MTADIHERPRYPVVAHDEYAFAEELPLHHLILAYIAAVGDRVPEVPHGPVPLRIALGDEGVGQVLHGGCGHAHRLSWLAARSGIRQSKRPR